MKKIFTVLVMALAMSLAFTGCASKKASKGPKTYSIDIGYTIGGAIERGKEVLKINISSLLPQDQIPAEGEKVRVMWTFASDVDLDAVYVSLGDDSKEYILAENIEADDPKYYSVVIPVESVLSDPIYVSIWTDEPVVLETCYPDAK